MKKNNQSSDLEFSMKIDKHKKVKVIFEILILSLLCFFIIYNIFYTKTYKPYSDYNQSESGFIALSYFGVQKTAGSQLLISQKRLRQHLQALKKQGYETISSEDIYDYYTKGKKLPKKAVYLMFEDGRRDTAIFSKPILEDLNYKATIFSYPENFIGKDTKFLSPEDLKNLTKTSYWELGTNGYRLYYINVFDRYNNYLGEMTPLMFAMTHKYIGRRYNHYLMDYIRDKNGIPEESYQRMKDRISYDYEKLEKLYINKIGYVPTISVLMHANTSRFGNNYQVSDVNAYWLKKLFDMNFNREGFCLNLRNSSIYDLTRMQPQAWWPANHLLMRIKYDNNQNMIFEIGDQQRAAYWDIIKGACEFRDEKIYLTTLPKKDGIIELKKSNSFKNFKLDVELQGNKKGTQGIFVRSNENRSNYILLLVNGNTLVVQEKYQGKEKKLVNLDLNKINNIPAISLEEDKHNAKMAELEAFSRYAPSKGLAKVYSKRLLTETKKSEPSVQDGAVEYVPEINSNEKGEERISLILKDAALDIMVNGKKAASVEVSDTQEGRVFLFSEWTGHGFDQRNLTDDVYDAVFNKLTITNLPNKNILFTSEYKGVDKIVYEFKDLGEKIVNWFVKYL